MDGLAFLIVVAVCGIAVWSAVRGAEKCRAYLDEWAAANGYELVRATRRWATLSFFWRSKAQRVYEIEVRDAQGRQRAGKAKVGGYFLGSMTNRVDVRWSD